MSFSADVKNEICGDLPTKKCDCIAECYGILLFCNTFTQREVRIITESVSFAQRLPRLFKRAFGISFDIVPPENAGGKQNFVVFRGEKLSRIFDAFGYGEDGMLSHHINLGVIEEECCRQSFVRGAFLAGGSVTDPLKSYHLEINTDHFSVSREMYALLLDMGLSPKDAARSGNYMIYFKQSAAIEDILTLMGAPVSAMEIMSAKIEKDMRNSVNRRVNCDTANVLKTVDASQQQLEAIRVIEANMGIASLPEKLRETAEKRLMFPELSSSELASALDPPVTKSCINHRLRKLSEIAEEIKKNKE